jgi:tetratricopeptide (TPR) repeat protein
MDGVRLKTGFHSLKRKEMTLDIQETMFLQALDYYSYDLEQCIEKLQYAMNGPKEHAGIQYLIGRMHAEQSGDYRQAKFHFQMALSIDHTYVHTYPVYVDLLIQLREYEEALRVIKIGIEIPGSDTAYLLYLQGILYEKYEMYCTAMECYKAAKNAALNSNFFTVMDAQLQRVKKKRKAKAKTAKKSKKK